jgi:hypothetical protein
MFSQFQREYEVVVGGPLDLNMRREVTLRIALILVICSAVTSFPYLTLREIRPWYAVPFFHRVCSCVLNTGMWHTNGRALVRAARALMGQLERVS